MWKDAQCHYSWEKEEYYAKWNKSVIERQIPYDFTHMWIQWTNWTNKQNRDSLIDREQAASPGEGCWGLEGLSQKEKELMDTDNSVVIVGMRGLGGGERGYKGDK